jgi:hypothetical protein
LPKEHVGDLVIQAIPEVASDVTVQSIRSAQAEVELDSHLQMVDLVLPPEEEVKLPQRAGGSNLQSLRKHLDLRVQIEPTAEVPLISDSVAQISHRREVGGVRSFHRDDAEAPFKEPIGHPVIGIRNDPGPRYR